MDQSRNVKYHIMYLHTSILRRDVEVPINPSVLSIPFLQPLIRLLEVSTIQEALVRTQRARMHTSQNQMRLLVDRSNSLLRRRSPSKKNNPFRSSRGHGVDNLLREPLPALVLVAIGIVSTDSKACIQE